MAASTLMRSVARRSFEKAIRLNAVTPVTSIASRSFATYYTPAHEYCKVDGKIATVGITDFAQSALGDIVFIDLPEEEDEFDKGDSFGSVESVKAASDVYAPVSGTVVGTNDKLDDKPEIVNTDAEGDAWFVKLEISDESELEDLMSAEEYKAHCDAQ
mmetsp:Transcript_21950/g.26461  ORF Transcript_21950/g.26461 Transcript_21950/m.26461 type:complete len:158 (-) Transcript_21950:87-560(-)|eukprot:CAMPEP_0195259024 /NCGR_PEP_ID=MMETSP0706-20130129/7718_1 /TAXON_ID=33640 /ORGANISM="Asterionellopsis glacialis, Strain CCMP134" /LENGTH=157 /DNA_ID=CAMNT_0040312445 /DNA_START=116 /DNA_END=589 /DNA_ORIENTATION=+